MDAAFHFNQVFSLTHGGPLFAVLKWIRLFRPSRLNAFLLGLGFAALAWVPMTLLAIAHWFTASELPPLMRDPAVHFRLLVAIPLFFVAEALLEERCAASFHHVVEGFVRQKDAAVAIAHRAARMRDSWLAEAVFFALAVAIGQSVLWGVRGGSGAMQGVAAQTTRSAAFVWYAVVGFPVFLFFMQRSFYRWAIWSRMLMNLSRLDLDLVPTHPDLAGGLEIISEPVEGFAMIALATNGVVAATWGYRVFAERLDPQAFTSPFVLLVLLVLLMAFGALLCFSFRLWRVRLEGIRAYSEFARRYTKGFHDKWIAQTTDESALGSADIQSLADLGNSFDRVERMRFVPFGARLAALVLAATLGPMLPILALVKPIPELFASLGHALLGGFR